MARFITRHNEYRSLFPCEFYLRSEHFLAAVSRSDEEFSLGITIGKSVGKAHQRNKLKRRIKAFIRSRDELLPHGFKLNLIARVGAAQLSWPSLCDQLNQIIQSLKDRPSR
ncbi:MAG: ribonuclease P protein component [Candidatus Cloacimonadaceae bacterium]|jgi:ribonuclease P protein component